jgi:hypothetical protein
MWARSRVVLFGVLVALVALSTPHAAAQGPTAGLGRALQQFFNVVCTADPSFEFDVDDTITIGGLSITATDEADDGGGIRSLDVTVTHGPTDSAHTIFYEDGGGESLTCDDTITGVI